MTRSTISLCAVFDRASTWFQDLEGHLDFIFKFLLGGSAVVDVQVD